MLRRNAGGLNSKRTQQDTAGYSEWVLFGTVLLLWEFESPYRLLASELVGGLYEDFLGKKERKKKKLRLDKVVSKNVYQYFLKGPLKKKND